MKTLYCGESIGGYIYERAAPTPDEIVEKFSELIGLRVIARQVSGKTKKFDWKIELSWADVTDFPKERIEITAYSFETSPWVVENDGEVVKEIPPYVDRADRFEFKHLVVEGPLSLRHQPKAHKSLKEGQFCLVNLPKGWFMHESTFMFAVMFTLFELGALSISPDGTSSKRESYFQDDFKRFPISLEDLKARRQEHKSETLVLNVLMLPILFFCKAIDFFSSKRRFFLR